MLGNHGKTLSRRVLVTLGTTITAIACGHTSPPAGDPSSPKAASGGELHERIIPHTCAARAKLASVLGRGPTTPESAPPPPAAATPPTSAAPPSAAGAVTDVYRVVAPATVLVLTPNAMGTGVVVDPRGYILTNWHVVADGRRTDFIDTVNVTFGDLSPTGRMVKQEAHFEAAVVKRDVIRDLALLKLKNPPPKLNAIRLATSAPRVGDHVTSIGNAGIGFLWAAKSCSIASVGERQQDMSSYAALDCSNVDPGLTAADAARSRAECEETKKKVDDALLRTTQGLAVQTDCAMTHGDSGGPLVNGAGELVGLNQGLRADLATVSFHVHIDEIRDFTKAFPTEPAALLPDPYCDGGSTPSLEDLDYDGIPESLVAKDTGAKGTVDRVSLLIDIDEDDAKRSASRAPGAAEGDAFDAEIALVTNPEGTFVWYDTDNDGRFDLLLVDKNHDGMPEKAYRVDANGIPKEDPPALTKHVFTDRYVKVPAQQVRLGKIARAIGGSRYGSPLVLGEAARAAVTLPDPLTGGGNRGRAYDSDNDGKADVAVVHGTFTRGLLIDADESSLGKLKNGAEIDALLKTREVDPEVVLLSEIGAIWASYDLDNDGKFDLALESTNVSDMSALFVTRAFHLPDMSPAPEQLGRRVLRPTLVPALPRVGTAFRLMKLAASADEGIGSLPDLIPSKAEIVALPVKGFPDGTAVMAVAGQWSTTFCDIDHNTKLRRPVTNEDVEHALADGKLDAEVAIVQRTISDTIMSWVFYDTDNDGNFDWIVYSPNQRETAQAYRVKNERLEVDPPTATGKPIRTKAIFKNKALGARWRTLARTLYKAPLIEE